MVIVKKINPDEGLFFIAWESNDEALEMKAMLEEMWREWRKKYERIELGPQYAPREVRGKL